MARYQLMTKRKEDKSPKPAAAPAENAEDKPKDAPVADGAPVASDPENAKLADSLHANA